MVSVEPFNRLVRLTARAFYDDLDIAPSKGNSSQPTTKTSRDGGDNRGAAVIVLDVLTRCQWVQEDELAQSLHLAPKQLRRVLRYFEEEKLVTRDHRKEKARPKSHGAAADAAAAGDGQPAVSTATEGEPAAAIKLEEPKRVKTHTYSYCCLDYAQLCDVVRYRIHRVKQKLRKELEKKEAIQKYACPSCKRKYSAFDVPHLVSLSGEYFSCENCGTELLEERDDERLVGMGDGDDALARVHDMLRRIDEQLRPLTEQLARVQKLPAPEFGTLRAWEIANARASAQGQFNGASMPDYLGETTTSTLDVVLPHSGVAGESGADGSAVKVVPLPPWMITPGMNLTAEQRGETATSTSKPDEISEGKDDEKKQDTKVDDSSIQYHTEFLEAYYKALRERQEQEEAKKVQLEAETFSSESLRQVGTKSKRDDDEDDGVEWEEVQPAEDATEPYTSAELSVEATESAYEFDDIDWQDG